MSLTESGVLRDFGKSYILKLQQNHVNVILVNAQIVVDLEYKNYNIC